MIAVKSHKWCPDELIPLLYEEGCPTFIGFVPNDNQSLSDSKILVFRVHTYVHGWNDLRSFITDNYWRRVERSSEE